MDEKRCAISLLQAGQPLNNLAIRDPWRDIHGKDDIDVDHQRAEECGKK